MKSHYSQSAVQPIKVEKNTADQISFQYNMPMESLYYSPGVNFRSEDGTLRVYIERCGIKDRCEPMAKAPLPSNNGWQVAVTLPHRDEKVVVMHSDQEQQVYP